MTRALPRSVAWVKCTAHQLTYIYNSGGRSASFPPLFHITHHKAGSQWIFQILRHAFPQCIVDQKRSSELLGERCRARAAVYPTLYLARPQFAELLKPENWLGFFVMRDLRDTLISGYYSLRYSHAEGHLGVVHFRNYLEHHDLEQGLIYMMDRWLPPVAAIQDSWLDVGLPVLRYEHLLENDEEIMENLLLDRFRLPVRRSRLRAIVRHCRFSRATRGRLRGAEDSQSHQRKAVAGDWKNYLKGPARDAMKERYGALLVRTGYATDSDW